ncbi:hypothetical protein [Oribacterium sp. WCC10]|uniref:hypothetical protein n=1 Tax=Oribacterium sp. WCC10 TaxID=1855343 RepID=UPI0008E0B70D|nr:hypothetical protein [Oribacterium sp. WCC10]SFG15062.1 hypothetical protein SAMN05216356_102168 [Oribacterium sp. WCC10]
MKQYEVRGNTVRAVDAEEMSAASSTVVIEQRGHRDQIHLYRTGSGQIRMEYTKDKSVIKPIFRCIPAVVIDRICYVALVISLIVIFASSYQCISLDTKVSTRLASIERKRSELEDLRLKNEEIQSQINNALDLDAIYREATEVYGMALPSEEDEVIVFEKGNTGYVRARDDLPKNYTEDSSVTVLLMNELSRLLNKS